MRLTSAVVSCCYSMIMSSSITKTQQQQQQRRSLSSSTSSNNKFKNLSKAWAKDFVINSANKKSDNTTASLTTIQEAIQRTLPLLLAGGGGADNNDPAMAVPFVCRYRTELISPLTTNQIHVLADYLQKHQKLATLRKRILDKIEEASVSSDINKSTTTASEDDRELSKLIFRVETSISKNELEDLYAPYKPPSTGSLEDRILQENPELVQAVDTFWNNYDDNKGSNIKISELKPRTSAITLLANRIASYPTTMDACYDYTQRTCRIKISEAKNKNKNDTKSKKAVPAAASAAAQSSSSNKYQTYYNFDCLLNRLKDYQVLAIRRGVDRKELTMKFDIDSDYVRQSIIPRSLRSKPNFSRHQLWIDSIDDAWTRLLRKRCTTRYWNMKCQKAEERSVDVFCNNLHKALLEPPLSKPKYVLAVDPGYKAGIKIAMLNPRGDLIFNDNNNNKALRTVYFTTGSNNRREKAIEEFAELLRIMQQQQQQQQQSDNDDDNNNKDKEEDAVVTVALGNGHGTLDARKMLMDASELCNIPIDIRLVNEAGASVWSVTDAAGREFPANEPASIAAISIGRRYQNPLPELIKIPARSLGLGMYQHDSSSSVLEQKLHVTSVDAVAEVGVYDVNACSIDILSKVPGITQTLATRIIRSRPIRSRQDLLAITGIGPKTYENCAAFIRVQGGPEILDKTLVHPESYDLARYLLTKLNWDLTTDTSSSSSVSDEIVIPPEQDKKTDDLACEAAARFDVSKERVLSVIDHLYTSITNPDPRLRKISPSSVVTQDLESQQEQQQTAIHTADGCSSLPSNLLSSLDELRKTCPIRNVLACVRNVVDFGVFVDYGGENDALIHRSKMGGGSGNSLLVGQEIGIDILGVSQDGRRITASLSGLGLPAESSDNHLDKNKRAPADGQSKSSRPINNKKRRTSNQTRNYSSKRSRRK